MLHYTNFRKQKAHFYHEKMDQSSLFVYITGSFQNLDLKSKYTYELKY